MNRISLYRRQSKLTQSKLAIKMGISQKRVSQLESGTSDPSIFEIHKMTYLFNCSFEDLYPKKEERGNGMNIFIKYKELEKHADPDFTHLTYGDADNLRGANTKKNAKIGSYAFFHTSIGDQEYITAYYLIDKILERGADGKRIDQLNSAAKVDHIVLVGDRNKSKILSTPLALDRKLIKDLPSLGITENYLDNSKTELFGISSKTRNHRTISDKEANHIIQLCKNKG
ncbi:hypothetical protein JCM19037_1431 [Geomicrobium sp. JCM 19037]|uniref:helix-turn-helix transcriptional regulator n=1 Tax=Geomicrobium sp. JCM 19037 TaxID=1460634 RepID=UPI00045F3DCF|nr:helix-turn-helix transcriptional regulator [Geomicrobium sp. JCM 19037]GAK03136.1 hypothetical protein JCM19037_1431 [Geomicrobium sp. JCM 19037]